MIYSHNRYATGEFEESYDVDGSIISFQGPQYNIGDTTITLDLTPEDQPLVSFDKGDGDYTSRELRLLIEELVSILFDMENYETDSDMTDFEGFNIVVRRIKQEEE